MKKTVLIDSSAWIELFIGSSTGKSLLPYQSTSIIILSPINVFEVYGKLLSLKPDLADFYADTLLSWGQLAEITPSIAMRGAQLRKKYAFSMADALILATAEAHHAELITCDYDFHGVKEAVVTILQK